MRIGLDFDGTITENGWFKGKTKFPWWLVFLVLTLLEPFIRPKKATVTAIKEWVKEKDSQIIIISARSVNLKEITEAWLLKYQIPFDRLILVGTGQGLEERKWQAVQEAEIDVYFDDDLTFLDFLKRNKKDKLLLFCL